MSKYGAIAVEVDGIRFASKREAARYGLLRVLEGAGQISGLVLQPRFPLVVEGEKICTYVADFQYTDCTTGAVITEDCKGMKTPVYRLKAKLLKALHGIAILET